MKTNSRIGTLKRMDAFKKIRIYCPAILAKGMMVILGVLGLLHAGNTEIVPGESVIVSSRYPILAMDYDPKSGNIYYIQQRIGDNALLRHEISTGKDQILQVLSPNSLGWVGLSRRETIFVLDQGDNPFDLPWKATVKPAQILEIKGSTVVATIPLLVPSRLSHRSGAPQQTTESIARGASIFIAESVSQTPLGVDRIDRLLRLKGVQETTGAVRQGAREIFVPRFLLLNLNSNNPAAVMAEYCEIDFLRQFRDRLVQKNLSRISESVVAETEKTGDALLVSRSRGFSFRMAAKGFGFYNLPCEKLYDQIVWRGKKFNLGSCAHGVRGLPQSLEAFTPDGDFLYFRWSGIHRLRLPKE